MRVFGYNLTPKKRDSAPAAPKNPLDERYYTDFPFAGNKASVVVNPHSALKNPTVYACVKVISETAASMPLILYRRLDERKRKRAVDHPLFRILKNAPNPRQTSFEFREMLFGHYLLRGNAYAQILRDSAGDPAALYVLNPDAMKVSYNNDLGSIVYEYTNKQGVRVYFSPEQILHLRGPSDDNLVGRSPINCFSEAIALGMSMEEYLSRFYANNASPAGVLQMAAGQDLSKKAKERLKDDWVKKFGGSYNAGGVAVLEEGMTWEQVGMTATDAQLLETWRNQVVEIARCFRMPLHKIGMMDKATFSNIEFQGIEFYTDTMLPHLTRFEQMIDRDLLNNEKPDKYFAEFMVDAILRGDIVNRYKAYAIGRQWGWLSVNDVRAKENEDAIEGGDVYLQPLNMIDATQAEDYLMSQNDKSQPGVKGEGEDPGNPTLKKSLELLIEARNANTIREIETRIEQMFEKVLQKLEKPAEIEKKSQETPQNREKIADPSFFRVRAAATEVFAESIDRVLKREETAVFNARKKNQLGELEKTFYPDHRGFTRDRLRAAVGNYIEQVRLFASVHEHSCIPDVAVPKASEQVLDKFTDLYYSRYKDAGPRVAEVTRELATILTQIVERAATHVLITTETKESERNIPNTIIEPKVELKVDFPKRTGWKVSMGHDKNGVRTYDVLPLDGGGK